MAGPVDLTLRLGRSSGAGDEPKQFPHGLFNAKFGVPNVTQLGLSSGLRIPGATLGNNAHAVPFSSTSIMEFQRSLYFGNEPVALPPPTKMMEYCVINVSNRRGRVGGSKKRKATENPPPPPALRLFNDFRYCTNINCRNIDTPMWRRGPLGPKTLCNACGIKYRKTKPLLAEEFN